MAKKKPNLILIGVDSMRADHMSLYGYDRLTTPHIDDFAAEGTAFEWCFSPHIPTTSGYGSMLTGRDCFGTDTVALRHKGPMAEGVPTLAEVLREQGYETTCVGFKSNPAGRGFDNYLDFSGWGSWKEGRSHKAENLNDVALPELKRLADARQAVLPLPAPHGPARALPAAAPVRAHVLRRRRVRPGEQVHGPGLRLQALLRLLRHLDAAGRHGQGLRHRPVRRRGGLHGRLRAEHLRPRQRAGAGRGHDVVLDSDHGETLYDHDCYFDHHGIYEPTLHVPLVFRMPGSVPAGLRLEGYTTLQDVMPTILDIMGIRTKIKFDGQSLFPEMKGKRAHADARSSTSPSAPGCASTAGARPSGS